MTSAHEELLVGLVSISDRASQGVYKDEGIPALEEWLGKAVSAPAVRVVKRLIPDERPAIEAALKELVDKAGCHLVLTTGGTGPAPRDVTPEATLACNRLADAGNMVANLLADVAYAYLDPRIRYQ